MAKFIAIKIHYDHRNSLPDHLKYSRKPTNEEYQEYLNLFREENIGGEGFHECLNFSIPESGSVKIYLPPTCLPDKKYFEEEFVIFSFTYKYDREVPACVVGVHANARFLSREGIERKDVEEMPGLDNFVYFAESPAEYVTLITKPLEYNFKDGIYTPPYKSWGNGLRYIEEKHADNIISSAIESVKNNLPLSGASRKIVLDRQIEVLKNIQERYFSTKTAIEKGGGIGRVGAPDQESGYAGELFVYQKEIEYAKQHGIPVSEVEWISQSVPSSPYDIKSVRKTDLGFRDHYIEVKSSRAGNEANIYISSRQIEFFQSNEIQSSFMFVKLSSNRELLSIRELSLNSMLTEFELEPIKFKLRSKQSET